MASKRFTSLSKSEIRVQSQGAPCWNCAGLYGTKRKVVFFFKGSSRIDKNLFNYETIERVQNFNCLDCEVS
jgi:hypothetical protein